MRIGIPRALLYYQYYPMWHAFFTELGADVVVSPKTTRDTLATGSSRVVTDTCLPVKVFCGHVLALVGECDYVFIPVVRSVRRKVYNCAKFLGLPDMTRAVIPETPPILEIEIDVNLPKRTLYREIYRLGRHLTWNPSRIRRAALAAWQAHLDYQKLMAGEKLTPPQAIARITGNGGENDSPRAGQTEAAIAVIGHPYLLYDEYLNHRIIRRLEQSNVRVLTPEMSTPEELAQATAETSGQQYWTYEGEVVGAATHYLESGTCGVIGLMAFGCGPDSLMMDMVHRRAARQKVTPFMCLSLDEHTAETGIITRLEAFRDMIEQRERKRAKVCV